MIMAVSELSFLQEYLHQLSADLRMQGNCELAATIETAEHAMNTLTSAAPAVKALYENAAHWRGLRDVTPKGFTEGTWLKKKSRKP